jgi:hypothetical protein
VKSGNSGKLKSLHMFMDNSDSQIAVRFYSGKYSVEKVLTQTRKEFILINLPLFLTGKVREYVTYVRANY